MANLQLHHEFNKTLWVKSIFQDDNEYDITSLASYEQSAF